MAASSKVRVRHQRPPLHLKHLLSNLRPRKEVITDKVQTRSLPRVTTGFPSDLWKAVKTELSSSSTTLIPQMQRSGVCSEYPQAA